MNTGLVAQTGWRPGLLHAQHSDFNSTHEKGHDEKYDSSQVELKFIPRLYQPATICGLIPDKNEVPAGFCISY